MFEQYIISPIYFEACCGKYKTKRSIYLIRYNMLHANNQNTLTVMFCCLTKTGRFFYSKGLLNQQRVRHTKVHRRTNAPQSVVV